MTSPHIKSGLAIQPFAHICDGYAYVSIVQTKMFGYFLLVQKPAKREPPQTLKSRNQAPGVKIQDLTL